MSESDSNHKIPGPGERVQLVTGQQGVVMQVDYLTKLVKVYFGTTDSGEAVREVGYDELADEVRQPSTEHNEREKK